MKRLFGYMALSVAVGVVVGLIFQSCQVKSVRLTVLDVGQGDAILIQAPGQVDVLIDGGPDAAAVEGLGERLSFFNRTIELMVLTHPDADHVNGLVEVARRYRVLRFLSTGVSDELPAYQALLDELRKQNTEFVVSRVGQAFAIPNSKLSVLGPAGDHQGEQPEDGNALSVVLRLEAGGHGVLLTGDADETSEAEMIFSGQTLTADVLKLGHHGSRTANTEEFIQAVAPRLAIVSAGAENRFGHPHPEVIERVKREGAQVLSTADQGDICLELEKERIERCR